MAIEKRWKSVAPQQFVVDNALLGKITVNDATLFKVKQQVVINSSTISNRDDLEVKRISDRVTIFLGPKTGNIDSRVNLSAYTPSDTPIIYANEQQRVKIPEQEIERLTYEEEPVVARRVIQVDEIGLPLKTVLTTGSDKASLGVSVDQISQNLTFSSSGHLITDNTFQGLAAPAVIVTSSTAVQIQQNPGTPLQNRSGIFLMAMNTGNYFGFSNAVNTDNGLPIFQNQLAYIPASSGLIIWAVRATGTGEIRAWEVG
jgi:hypothetical protein